MAQTEIDELLNSIRAEYQVNSDMFGKALTDINSKLEDIANDGITAELIKTTLQDVKTDLDARHRFVTEKFENIKEAFETLNQNQDLLVKNSDLKIMFNILNENVENFAHEITEQQALINDVEAKITDFRNDNSKKDEILEKVAVVKEGIDEVNRGLQASIMDVNSSLRNITKNLMTMDVTEQNDIIKRELENIYLAVNALISSMEIIDQKNDDIAKNILAKDDLISLSGKIDNSFALMSEKIDSFDVLLSEKNTGRIILEIEKNRNELLSFNENVSKGLSEYLNSVRDVLLNCIDEIKKTQALASVEDGSLASQKFENIERLSVDIKKIDTTLSSQNESYINLISSKIKEFGIVIDNFKKYVDESHSGIEENLQAKLNTLDGLISNGSSMLSDRFSQLQEKVEQSIKSIEIFAEDNSIKLGNSLSEMSDIKSEITRILDNMTAFNSHQEANLSNLDSHLEGDFSDLKNDLNGFCSSFEALKYTLEQSNIDNRGLLAEIVEDAANKTRSIVENLNNNASENVLKNIDMQMELVKEQFNDLRNIFTSISAKNVENILTNIEQAYGKLDNLNSNLTDNLDKNFQIMRDLITVSGSENNRQIAELDEKFTSVSQTNATGIMNEINAASAKLDNINSNLFGNLDDKFASVKESVNISGTETRNQVEELGQSLVSTAQANSETIVSNITNVSSKIDDLNASLSGNLNNNFITVKETMSFVGNDTKQHIDGLVQNMAMASHTNTGNIISEITTVSAKIDTMGVDLATELDNNFEMVKEFIENSKEDKSQNNAELAALSDCIKNLETEFSNNTEKFQTALNEQMNSLENYIAVLKECNSKDDEKTYDEDFEKLAEKLLAVETALHEAGEDFGDNLMMVQNKIADYAQSVDYVSKETGEKLENSLEEIKSVRAELASFIENMSKPNDEASEKIFETLNFIQTKFDDVLVNINDIKEDVSGNVTSALQHNAALIEDKFTLVQELLNDNNLKNIDRINECDESVKNKIDTLKQEIGLVNTDISEIITSRAEALSNEFVPLKESIDTFLNTDFNKIIDSIKSQIELSYLNFSADVNENMTENHDNYVQLNEAYQTLVEKFGHVEEIINDLSLNQIGVMTSTITEVESNIANNFDKTNKLLESWKNDLKRLESKIDNGSKNNEIAVSASLKELTDDIKKTSDAGREEIISNLGNLETCLTSKLDTIKSRQVADAEKLTQSLNSLNEKVDIIAMSDPSANLEDLIGSVQDKIEELFSSDNDNEKLKTIETAIDAVSSKMDVIAFSQEENSVEEIKEILSSLNDKIDLIAVSDNDDKLDDIENIIKSLHDKVDVIASSDNEEKIENMVQALHEKVDILALSEDSDLYTEIQDIKGLIVEQRKQIEQFGRSERSDNVDKYLEDLENRLSGLDFAKNTSDIKDSVMNAILAVADQITFAEETEEIKDFVEERTDEINKNLLDVKQQLSNIACSSEAWDYSYTMQDIESDIAKLRIILNDISASTSKDEINEISQNMHKIAASVNTLHSSLTEDQILELKNDIEKINSDVISLSARTNKLLLSSDESYKALIDGLDEFSRVTNQLQKRLDVLDSSGLNEIIEKKLDSINDAISSSANSDNVMRQVMLYLGEWIDDASEKLNTISTDTSNLSLINSELCLLKTMMDNRDITKVIEKKFSEQQKKINNLESKLENLIETVENHENPMLNHKFEIFGAKINAVDEKLENLDDKLTRLSQGIEKLASYVD